MNADEKRLNELSEAVIGAAFEVSNTLGAGFLEKVYERALLHELTQRGISAKAQQAIKVRYKDVIVGDYLADLVVEDAIVVDLKCDDGVSPEQWHNASIISTPPVFDSASFSISKNPKLK